MARFAIRIRGALAHASFLRMLAALALALGLVACRELTAPVQPEPGAVLARGLFVRSDGSPLTNASVEIQPQASELRYTFRASVTTDHQGRFETWVPNLPMFVILRPDYSIHLPEKIESDVQFRSGEVRTFVLNGDFFPGVMVSNRFAKLLSGAGITLRTNLPSAAGESVTYSEDAEIGDDGRFEIFLPQEGRYWSHFHQCCDTQISFDWPDSIEIAKGDTIRLDLPLVDFELELRVGGLPVLSYRKFVYTTDFWQLGNDFDRTLEGDGSTLLFDVVGLAGATRIGFSSSSDGTSDDPKFLRTYFSIPPLTDGDRMNLELGQYLFQVHVVDPKGDSVSASVYLYGEDSLSSPTTVSTQADGKAYYQVNAGGFHLRVIRSGFSSVDRYFSLSGDSQMEIEIQPLPSED